ncbi:MAG: radical SAM protein [Agathobacter sp.]|nr:radical SAM protein [Agathobacter sp.]
MSEFIHDIDLEELATKKDMPYSASIEILTKCNFKCEHCYIPHHTEEMKYDVIINIVNQLKELGVVELMITGGEIALHKHFMDIVRYVRKLGIRLILFSNISLLNEDQIKVLSELYITEISTSLFSLNDKINSSITGVENSGEKVIENALLIRKYNIPLEIKVPIMKKNRKSYKEIEKFCDNNGIKITYTTAITSKTDGNCAPCEFALCQKELNEFILKNDPSSMEVTQNYSEICNDYVCKAVGSNLHIDVKGHVYPCISFPYVYGSILEDSLEEIWYKSNARKVLKNIRKGELTGCVQCDLNNVCLRCPGLAYSEQKSLLGCSILDKKLAISRKTGNSF